YSGRRRTSAFRDRSRIPPTGTWPPPVVAVHRRSARERDKTRLSRDAAWQSRDASLHRAWIYPGGDPARLLPDAGRRTARCDQSGTRIGL
ncbi:hypothetical protein LTR94_036229, partial [Friedmanniomyces endolithicus]